MSAFWRRPHENRLTRADSHLQAFKAQSPGPRNRSGIMPGSHRLRVVLAIAAIAAFAASPRAQPLPPETARALVGSGDILPLQQVLARLRPAIEGEIVAVALVREQSRYLYKIKALGDDGRYRERRADARTGVSADDR
jgi:hypothetical protein